MSKTEPDTAMPYVGSNDYESALRKLEAERDALRAEVERLTWSVNALQDLHRDQLRSGSKGYAEMIVKLEAERDDARDYVADIAAGVAHYPHEEDGACVRCERDRLLAQVDEQGKAWLHLWNQKEQAKAECAMLRVEPDGAAVKVSRQLAWQQRMLDLGRCRSCGRHMVWLDEERSKTRCRRCLDKKKVLYKAKKPY